MSIFRKAALDRLSSPEQLDQLMQLTRPRAWAALLGLVALLVAAAAWGVLGSIPTRVEGQGILVRSGGISAVHALASGQLVELSVKAGAPVAKGQPVARLWMPDLEAELRGIQAGIDAAEAQHLQLTRFASQDSRLQADSIAQRRLAAQNAQRVAEEREAALRARATQQRQLLEQGLITEAALQATRDAAEAARGEVERARAELKELSARGSELHQRVELEEGDRRKRVEELKRSRRELEDKIALLSRVVSPDDGKVLEVRAAVGAVVAAGTPLVTLEAGGAQTLEALVYVPAAEGKRVRPGVAIEVSPSTVRREEYGALRAVVRSVSDFPATQQAMLATLGNEELVHSFLRAVGTPIEVRAEIQAAEGNPSGLAWTSPRGPPTPVMPGTLCGASMIVQEQAPISLVVPVLKERLGL